MRCQSVRRMSKEVRKAIPALHRDTNEVSNVESVKLIKVTETRRKRRKKPKESRRRKASVDSSLKTKHK